MHRLALFWLSEARQAKWQSDLIYLVNWKDWHFLLLLLLQITTSPFAHFAHYWHLVTRFSVCRHHKEKKLNAECCKDCCTLLVLSLKRQQAFSGGSCCHVSPYLPSLVCASLCQKLWTNSRSRKIPSFARKKFCFLSKKNKLVVG